MCSSGTVALTLVFLCITGYIAMAFAADRFLMRYELWLEIGMGLRTGVALACFMGVMICLNWLFVTLCGRV